MSDPVCRNNDFFMVLRGDGAGAFQVTGRDELRRQLFLTFFCIFDERSPEVFLGRNYGADHPHKPGAPMMGKPLIDDDTHPLVDPHLREQHQERWAAFERDEATDEQGFPCLYNETGEDYGLTIYAVTDARKV